MRNKITSLMLMLTVTLLLSVAAAAQSTGSGGNGTGGAPSPDPNSQPGSMSGQSTAGQSTSTTGTTSSSTNTGKTLKGCIVSQGGNYMLQEKNGKMANLQSSQDLSSEVGKAVKIHGDWQKGVAASSSTSSNAGVSGTSTASTSSNAGMSGT